MGHKIKNNQDEIQTIRADITKEEIQLEQMGNEIRNFNDEVERIDGKLARAEKMRDTASNEIDKIEYVNELQLQFCFVVKTAGEGYLLECGQGNLEIFFFNAQTNYVFARLTKIDYPRYVCGKKLSWSQCKEQKNVFSRVATHF